MTPWADATVPCSDSDMRSSSFCEDYHQEHILDLIETKRWINLLIYLETPEGQDELWGLSTKKLMLGWNVLHALCAAGAPFPIVRAVAGSYPSLASELDVLNRTPLHVSVDCYSATGSFGVDVVEYLSRLCPEAASEKDDRGRTPLIRACEMMGESRFCRRGRDNDDSNHYRHMIDHSSQMIETLLWARPTSVLEEDHEGVSAIEHALCNNAPDDIVRALQREACHEARALNTKRRRPRLMQQRS
eukprot:CAMPEP_0197466204 /NCGR_PEP_ID=MMETSP1175-20131217/64930_1 /TAXON_ID=1003142 /ORGANISM="Triceratium dubium, Strain CCMP147" /LENGTH=244 /DNA_ID=CAMNT_0043002235 /DNA_START=209 /DNA_END=943 /DNA_ORIENTATION=+